MASSSISPRNTDNPLQVPAVLLCLVVSLVAAEAYVDQSRGLALTNSLALWDLIVIFFTLCRVVETVLMARRNRCTTNRDRVCRLTCYCSGLVVAIENQLLARLRNPPSHGEEVGWWQLLSD